MVDEADLMLYDNRVEPEHVVTVKQVSATEARWACSCYVGGRTSKLGPTDDFVSRAYSKHSDHVDRVYRRAEHYSFEW